MVYTNENWFVILLSQVYFEDLVTEIHYFSPLNDNISAQRRTRCYLKLWKQNLNAYLKGVATLIEKNITHLSWSELQAN